MIKLIFSLFIFSGIILQIVDTKVANQSIETAAIGGMAAAITVLAVYIRNLHRESQKVWQEHTLTQQRMYQEMVKKFEDSSREQNEVIRENTTAHIENKLETTQLRNTMKDVQDLIRMSIKDNLRER